MDWAVTGICQERVSLEFKFAKRAVICNGTWLSLIHI